MDHLLRDYPGHGAVYGETRPLRAKQGNFASNIKAGRIEAERQSTGKMSNKRSLRRGIRRLHAMIKIVLFAKFLRPVLASQSRSNLAHILRANAEKPQP